ncbi:MAG: ribonuclease HII [Clostridiaceae bacterium]|jgi:ribonuclease HII|nr:ribonuclease HII [Clostridiaceae bacterium]
MKTEKNIDKLYYERRYLSRGAVHICGVDEVGRGPLAGPVTVAAVILPLSPEDIIEGVDDSKKLSPKRREALAELIKKKATAYVICSLDNEVIDEINILEATKRCMKSAITLLSVKPDAVLIDAVMIDTGITTEAIIQGDAKSYLIGAASIIAKVHRDALMKEFAAVYPGYGFESNKGYGSATHINAIRELGLTPIHRKTFTKNFTAK